MNGIRCYFLDENGLIISVKALKAEAVSAAVSEGTKMAEQRRRCDSIEIWRGGERLYSAPAATARPNRARARSK